MYVLIVTYSDWYLHVHRSVRTVRSAHYSAVVSATTMLVIWKRFCSLTYSMCMYDLLLSILSLPACFSVNPKYIGVIHTICEARVLLFFFVATFFFGAAEFAGAAAQKSRPACVAEWFFCSSRTKSHPAHVAEALFLFLGSIPHVAKYRFVIHHYPKN